MVFSSPLRGVEQKRARHQLKRITPRFRDLRPQLRQLAPECAQPRQWRGFFGLLRQRRPTTLTGRRRCCGHQDDGVELEVASCFGA